MFSSAAAFNADISNWQTGQVENMKGSTSTAVPHCLFMDGVADFFFNFFQQNSSLLFVVEHAFFDHFLLSPYFVSIVFYVWVVGSVSWCCCI